LPQVLGARTKVTLKVLREGLFGDQNLSREVEVVILEAQTRNVLFRSERQAVIPTQEQLIFTLKALDEAKADRGTRLIVEVRDTRNEEIIAETESVLMKALEGW